MKLVGFFYENSQGWGFWDSKVQDCDQEAAQSPFLLLAAEMFSVSFRDVAVTFLRPHLDRQALTSQCCGLKLDRTVFNRNTETEFDAGPGAHRLQHFT